MYMKRLHIIMDVLYIHHSQQTEIHTDYDKYKIATQTKNCHLSHSSTLNLPHPLSGPKISTAMTVNTFSCLSYQRPPL